MLRSFRRATRAFRKFLYASEWTLPANFYLPFYLDKFSYCPQYRFNPKMGVTAFQVCGSIGKCAYYGGLHMHKRNLGMTVCAAFFPGVVFAEGLKEVEYTALPVIGSLAIVEIAPGMTIDDATEIMRKRGMGLVTEGVKLRASSPQGRTFDLSAVARFGTAGVDPMVRMSNAPYEEIGGVVDLGVFGGEIISVNRTVLASNADLPKPDELLAQLRQEYGEPSMVEIGGSEMTILYGWDAAGVKLLGLDSNLGGAASREFQKPGSTSTTYYIPCISDPGGEMSVEYNSLNDKASIAMDCSARYEVIYQSGPAQSKIMFSLSDYDRARKAREETDNQINEALAGAAKASNMDL
jgi:hypothetical protein